MAKEEGVPGFSDLTRNAPGMAVRPHQHGRGGNRSMRKMTFSRDGTRMVPGLLVRQKGGIAPNYYVDRTHRSVWNEEPEFPLPLGPTDFVKINHADRSKSKTVAPSSVQAMQKRKPCKADVEVVSYDWTPSCVLTDLKTGKQCWPSHTDAVCWWDCHRFTWTPFPLPTVMRDLTPPYRTTYVLSGEPCCEDPDGVGSAKRARSSCMIGEHLGKKREGLKNPLVWDADPSTPRLQFECIGNFCGPSCAQAYAIEKRMQHVIPLITIVAKMFGYVTAKTEHDEGFSKVTTAPPRELLQMFSPHDGGMDINEFRSMCSCGIVLTIRDPIFTTKKHVVEAQRDLASYESRMEELNRARQLKKMQKQQQEGAEIAKKIIGKQLQPESGVTTSEMLKAPAATRRKPNGKMTFDLLLKKDR